jgi:DNA-binding HxlR family transcriptional regulator
MRELMLGPKRFGELRADLPGISANVLTQRLEGLEGAGMSSAESFRRRPRCRSTS